MQVGALLKIIWHIHHVLKKQKAKVRWNDSFLEANWEQEKFIDKFQGYSLFSENSPCLSFEVLDLHKKVIICWITHSLRTCPHLSIKIFFLLLWSSYW